MWISRVGGVLVLAFGLYLLGVFNLGAFARERRIHITDKPLGYLGTVLVGIAFGAGWTPCIGPILGTILTYAATQADVSRGRDAARARTRWASRSRSCWRPWRSSAFSALFQRMRAGMVWMSRISGALLVVVAVLMITDYMTVITGVLQGWTPAALKNLL